MCSLESPRHNPCFEHLYQKQLKILTSFIAEEKSVNCMGMFCNVSGLLPPVRDHATFCDQV